MDGFLHKSAANSNIPQAGYAGTVAALALCLVLFFTFPDPIRSYVARVVVEQQAEAHASSQTLTLPLQRETALQIADEILGKPNALHPHSTASECSTLQLPLVQAKMEQVSDASVRLELECRARHAAQALDICQRIADQLVQSQPDHWAPFAEMQRSQAFDLTRRLALAKDAERAVAVELLTLEKERLRTAMALVERLPKPEPTPLPAAQIVDAQTVQLQQQIAQLHAKKEELLQTKTEAHPLVQEVEARLAQLKALQPLRKPEMIQNPTFAPRYASSPELEVQNALQMHEQKRTALSQQHTELRGRIEQLEGDLHRLQQPSPTVLLQTKIAVPTAMLEREGGHPSWFKLLAFLLSSLTLGGFVFMLVKQVSQQRVFHSWLQVRQELQLEVLGTASALAQESSRGTRAEFCLRNSILMAELIVFVLAITLTYALSMQSQLTQPPLQDPWGAMAEALDRVGEEKIRR
jgi:hypothetical protein